MLLKKGKMRGTHQGIGSELQPIPDVSDAGTHTATVTVKETEQGDDSVTFSLSICKNPTTAWFIAHYLQTSIFSVNGQKTVERNNTNYAEILNLLFHKPTFFHPEKAVTFQQISAFL